MIFPSDSEIREYAADSRGKMAMDHFFLFFLRSSSITSFMVSFLRAKRRSRSASYTPFLTRIWGKSDFGEPFLPGIDGYINERHINFHSLSDHFIFSISAHSRQDSMHEKETQIVSSLSPTRPIPGDLRLSKLKSFFSLLLSSKYPFKASSESKYDKVGRFILRGGITW